MAAVMAVGLVAQTQDPTKQDPQTQPKPMQTDDRKVTVQGCLERDYLYTPSSATGTTGTASTTAARTAQTMAPTPFKLTQVEIIKDEPASGTGTVAKTGTEQKDIELHVAPAASAKNVDLDAQVNHKVELTGTMSSKDMSAARTSTTAAAVTDPQMKAPPLLFKATNVKSISDKCQ
jgi:hypothetical protein